MSHKSLTTIALLGALALAGCKGDNKPPVRENHNVGHTLVYLSDAQVSLSDLDGDKQIDLVRDINGPIIYLAPGFKEYAGHRTGTMSPELRDALSRVAQSLGDADYLIAQDRYEARKQKEGE